MQPSGSQVLAENLSESRRDNQLGSLVTWCTLPVRRATIFPNGGGRTNESNYAFYCTDFFFQWKS